MSGDAVPVACPVCEHDVMFPRHIHDDGPCAFDVCNCVSAGVERVCPTCGAEVAWDADGEYGWSWVDEYDPRYAEWESAARAARVPS